MPSLATEFAGLRLTSPVIAGSAAITQDLDLMRRAEDAGAGAVTMKGFSDIALMRTSPTPRYAVLQHELADREAFTFYSYEQASSHNAEEYAEELARAREALNIPVIANVDCQDVESWLANTRIIAQAKPAAIEINVSCPHGSIAFTGQDVENRILEVVRAVREQVKLPLIVKLTPQLTSPVNLVKAIEETGVEAVTLFNRFTGLEMDIEEQRAVMHGGFAGHGGPWARNFVLRWVAEVSPQTDLQISASGGVTEPEHVVAYLLAGAATVQVVTGIYMEGHDIVRRLNAGLAEYLERHELESPEGLRALAAGTIVPLEEVDRRRLVRAEIQPLGTAPCRWECPIDEDAQGYINLIAEGSYDQALRLIKQNHPFPGVLGRCCHHPCETACTRTEVDDTIAIAALKRFAADHGGRYIDPTPEPPPFKPERVAIVGSGPGGLTAAYRLALMGYRSTVFEALPVAGGMLSVGIPAYRLPRAVVRKEIAAIESLGVEIRTNTPVGIKPSLQDLREQGYAAILLAVGGHRQRRMGVPDEELRGVIEGVQMLRAHNLGDGLELGRDVAVVGGGDVAVDAARVAIRLVDRVSLVYRRRREDMPARQEEVEEAIEEGVGLLEQLQPLEVLGTDGHVTGLRCARTRPTEPGPDGRVGFELVESEEQIIGCDTVVVAIGQLPDLGWLERMGLGHLCSGDLLAADPEQCTTCELDIFACGDAVTGPRPLVEAIAAGRRAAEAIAAYLRGEEPAAPTRPALPRVEPQEVIEAQEPLILTRRQREPRRPPEERRRDFEEVALGFPEEVAVAEARRCLSCGLCGSCGDCVRTCPWLAIARVDDVVQVDADKCDGCGLCPLICRQQAIQMVPREQ